jgi:hypothetical protein
MIRGDVVIEIREEDDVPLDDGLRLMTRGERVAASLPGPACALEPLRLIASAATVKA